MRSAAGASDRYGGAGRPAGKVDSSCAAPSEAGWWAWMDDAACRGVGVEEFFGAAAHGGRWCRRCPVVEVCFWWAMVVEADAGYHFGIWGGASPAVRARVAAVVGVGWARARLVEARCEWEQLAAGRESKRRAG